MSMIFHIFSYYRLGLSNWMRSKLRIGCDTLYFILKINLFIFYYTFFYFLYNIKTLYNVCGINYISFFELFWLGLFNSIKSQLMIFYNIDICKRFKCKIRFIKIIKLNNIWHSQIILSIIKGCRIKWYNKINLIWYLKFCIIWRLVKFI